MPLQMNTISGAEIREKRKSGMTSDQIAKELLNSPTRDEVKPSEVAQLKAENEKLKVKIDDLEDSNKDYSRIIKLGSKGTNTFTATMTDYDYITKLQREIVELKKKTLENPQKSFDAMCKVVVELQEENKKLKENSETQTTAIRALTKQLEYECGDTSDMEGLNEFLKNYSSKEDYKKFYDWFEMSEYDVEFIETEE